MMALSKDRSMAAEIESIIRAIPGVSGLFRTGGVVARIVDLGAQALGLRDDDAPLVAVERRATALDVDAALGVDASADGVEVVTRVHAAVETLIAAQGFSPGSIRLTIVNVEEPVRPPMGDGIADASAGTAGG